MKKRILALLVSVAVLIGLLPGVALAEEGVVMVTRSEGDQSDPMYFTFLSDALVYCVANDTGYIKLLDDTTSGVFIDVGKTAPSGIVFDLDGHTLTLNPSGGSTGTTTNGFRVLNGKEATVMNGTVVAKFDKDSNRVKVVFANYGTLTLEGVTVEHSGDISEDEVEGASMVAYTINNGGKLDVTNSTITNNVEGATTTNLVLAFGDYNSTTVADVTIDSDSVLNGDIGVYGVTDATSLEINGTLNGTIFDENNAADEDTIQMNGTLATADIASAVKYAAKGAVITLTKDLEDIGSITLPVGVTIDGNGHTISGNSSFTVAKIGTTVIKNVNFEDIINPGNTKLSAIYATGLTADADVTISGCSFDNMEWEAIQVTSSVDGATVAITDNVFRHTDTDEIPTSERHIHVQPSSAGYAMNLTITGNKLYDCGNVKAAIGVYYITEGGSVDMGGNYVSDVSGTDEGVSTIAVMLKGDDGYYNANELVLPLMDETLTNEVGYSFLAHGTDSNSWKGTFHNTLADAVAAATTDDTGEVVDTITLVGNITVSEAINLDIEGVTFNQNGKTITLNEGGSIISATELVVTPGEGCEFVDDTTDGYVYSVELKQLTVTFESDGETVDSDVVDYGETVAEPDDPTKDGYIFAGWYDGETEYDFNDTVTGEITLTAKWTADTQGTSYDGEDPTPSTEPDPTVESDPTVEPSTDNTPRSSTEPSDEAESSTGTVEPSTEPSTESDTTSTEDDDATAEGVDSPITFVDVPEDAWYADAVAFAVARGIFNPDGTGDNKFEPEKNTTRAMMFTMLARYAGVDTEGGETWYANGMAWAVENGISDGSNPDENVTREQLVTMLYRYAQLIGADVSVGEDTNILSYGDATGVSEWAVSAVQWACGAGIIKGYPDGTLRPSDFATRAEIAVIMQRFIELMSK